MECFNLVNLKGVQSISSMQSLATWFVLFLNDSLSYIHWFMQSIRIRSCARVEIKFSALAPSSLLPQFTGNRY